MQSNTPAAPSCGNCPLQHYPSPRLSDGIDALSESIQALSAVADLMSPTTTDRKAGLHTVNRENLTALLDVLTRDARWHLARAQSEYYALKRRAA